MTLDEFAQRVQAISDNRLQRMLDKARVDGPDEALALLEAEYQKRHPASAQVSPWDKDELTSQIRPLDEVLTGAERQGGSEPGFESWRPSGGAESFESATNNPFAIEPEKALHPSMTLLQEPSTSPGEANEPAETADAMEEMAPLPGSRGMALTGSDPYPTAMTVLAPEEKKHHAIVVAIVLLVLAGGLALWRAMVD